MEKADTDKNGYIDYIEFLKAAMDWRKVLSLENLKAAFRMFDRDRNGRLSSDELKKILMKSEKVDPKFVEQLIK